MKKQNIEQKTKLTVLALIIGIIGLTVFSLIFFQYKLELIQKTESDEYVTYSKHYVLITDASDREYWKEVYDGALQEGKKNRAYIEWFGKDMDSIYTINDLLRIAIHASVDGIILPGEEMDKERETLINEAVGDGIPVITVKSDNSKSMRQCYVGINNYNLGQIYGEQVIRLIEKRIREKPAEESEKMEPQKEKDKLERSVYVLANSSLNKSNQSIILLAIQDKLDRKYGKKVPVTVKLVEVENDSTFAAEEIIRDYFVNESKTPDIMICLNPMYTQCAFQAAVDYNKVGKIEILGYYDSEPILNAVAKNIVDSTIAIHTERMGEACVKALFEYEKTGYVSSYESIDVQLITNSEAKRIISRPK